MDFMFEDEVDEVGSDVEAYCPKCKADTTHVVISKYEDEIRRVQCNPCGDVHSFRKPRGEVEDDVPEPIAAKKRALLKKPTWEEFFAKHGEKTGKPYEFREAYSDNAIVTHPKFGRGFVTEVMSDSKVEITFKDARRVLVHNRKDMPGLPLAAEGDGIPSKGPKAKAVKSKAAKEDRTAAATSTPPPNGATKVPAPAAKPVPPPAGPPPKGGGTSSAKPSQAKAGVAPVPAKAAAPRPVAPARAEGKPDTRADKDRVEQKAAPKATSKPAKAAPPKPAAKVAKSTKPAKAAPAGKSSKAAAKSKKKH
jgi:Zn ribbon nucleic-acid-binding protein